MKKISNLFFTALCIFALSTFTACDTDGDNPNNTTTTTTRAGETDREDGSSSTTGTSGSTGNQSKQETNGSQNDATGTMTTTNRSTAGIDE